MITTEYLKIDANKPTSSGTDDSTLSNSEQEVFEEAKIQGYLLIKGRHSRLSARWMAYCHSQNRLCIRVRLAHKYGTVYGKLPPHQPLFTQTLYEALDCLCTTMPCGHVLIGQDYVLCTKVPITHAELLGRLLLWTIIGSTHAERACA